MSYLDRVKACNTYDLSSYLPFKVEQKIVGWVFQRFAARLAHHPSIFVVSQKDITFCSELGDATARSAAIADVSNEWQSSGLIRPLMNELYPVRETWSGQEHFQLDRVLVPHFGINAYGVHLNGFIRRENTIFFWIGQRSADRAVEPGKLDNMVAGGQPAGMTIQQNLIKECAEEAGMPENLARSASPAGTVRYCLDTDQGLKLDTLFCYDLEVPETFQPRNQDGEIEDFHLMPIEEVLDRIAEGDSFKFNVPLVILDFAIRHGFLTPDNEPDYEAILAGLHAPSPHVHSL